MPIICRLLASAFLATLLIGCDKAQTPPMPSVDSSTGGSANSSVDNSLNYPVNNSVDSAATNSVAVPAEALPPSDATLPVASVNATSDSGNARSPTQADPKELTKEQESTAMPLSGQTNNHSTADPIKPNK